MGEYESLWREFASTKFDTPLDWFKCSAERGQDQAMCCYCGKAL